MLTIIVRAKISCSFRSIFCPVYVKSKQPDVWFYVPYTVRTSMSISCYHADKLDCLTPKKRVPTHLPGYYHLRLHDDGHLTKSAIREIKKFESFAGFKLLFGAILVFCYILF